MKNERTLRLTLWEECKSLKVFFQLIAAKLKKKQKQTKTAYSQITECPF
jgi:hypothetical protein